MCVSVHASPRGAAARICMCKHGMLVCVGRGSRWYTSRLRCRRLLSSFQLSFFCWTNFDGICFDRVQLALAHTGFLHKRIFILHNPQSKHWSTLQRFANLFFLMVLYVSRTALFCICGDSFLDTTLIDIIYYTYKPSLIMPL